MMFNVPQFIDVEDKIVGPLGWKEILWMIGMGGILLVLWNLLSTQMFYIVAIPIGGLFAALAFYKPYGQPFIKVIGFILTFFFKPKVYIWKREGDIQKRKVAKKAPTTAQAPSTQKKQLTEKELDELAALLNRSPIETNNKRNINQ